MTQRVTQMVQELLRDVGKDAEMNATHAMFDYNKVVVRRAQTQWESSAWPLLHMTIARVCSMHEVRSIDPPR